MYLVIANTVSLVRTPHLQHVHYNRPTNNNSHPRNQVVLVSRELIHQWWINSWWIIITHPRRRWIVVSGWVLVCELTNMIIPKCSVNLMQLKIWTACKYIIIVIIQSTSETLVMRMGKCRPPPHNPCLRVLMARMAQADCCRPLSLSAYSSSSANSDC